MTKELQDAIEDFQESINSTVSALIIIVTELAKIIDENGINNDYDPPKLVDNHSEKNNKNEDIEIWD